MIRIRKHVIHLAALTSIVAVTSVSAQANDWSEPHPAFRIAGNLYYVGSKGLASYLVTTPQGHVLINSNLATTVPLLRSSIESLGFKFSDIKVLLISHAHWDHNAGSAAIKAMTGAQHMVMAGDADVVESGGKTDFHYGNDPATHYPPTKVDRVLRDGDRVTLGETTLIARRTAGHTRGTTTWTVQHRDGARAYTAVIIGSPNVNPGYRLVNNPRYPEIAADYQKGFDVLKSLPCDIFLGAHGSYFDLDAKYVKLKQGTAGAFIDPTGCRRFIADREKAFLTELEKQKANRSDR